MPVAIDVQGVSMHFNMNKEIVNSLKEVFIKMVRRELQYVDFIALEDITFQVEKGDVFGIVGLNGSGKSTLLKIISGILKPTTGKVRVEGLIAPLIELGAGFDLELTARENIYLNGAVLGYSKKYLDDRFDDIVEFSEMREFLDVPMKNYSSGMVARIGFAIATVTNPDVLIVDEILAVGDFHFQQKCEERIQAMIKQGTTVLIVSHSIEQIERLCNRVLWLKEGHMNMLGGTQEVCEQYKSS